MTVKNNMNVVVYVRSSKVDEDIQNQINECLEYAKDKGYTITNLYVETNESEELTLLLNDVQNGYIDVVLINSYDRLNRKKTRLFDYLDYFRFYDTQCICVKKENYLKSLPNVKELKKMFLKGEINEQSSLQRVSR